MRTRAEGERFWETETWSVIDPDDDGDDCCIADGKGNVLVEDGLDIADARIMAAAPDLVRALLAVEWVDNDTDATGRYTQHCPSCDAYFPKHAPDCALDAALRKAGVR